MCAGEGRQKNQSIRSGGDMDANGHVSNLMFLRWFQNAHVRILPASGVLLADPSKRFVVRQLSHMKFKRYVFEVNGLVPSYTQTHYGYN